MFLVMVMEGTCIICFPLMHTRYTLLPVVAIYGVFVGSEFVQHPIIVSKYMSSDVQSIAMGCINLFSGLLGFVLPSYIGYFRDTIGSYNGIFYINGVLEGAVGFLWIFVPFITRCYSSKAFNSNEC
ncbi:uncharacterized protein LOC118205362 [Stegodyphus dumicola]|uniref:uncharacterized protein LOC118205362 n=1 Tax=Stegodyphus dumicola TaxID=202533 RepID=UPI0015B1D01B|nr:uncharacterized protein LOC118205362 [Stegodyphus dumicola]